MPSGIKTSSVGVKDEGGDVLCAAVGTAVGATVGTIVGTIVGASVGAIVGTGVAGSAVG